MHAVMCELAWDGYVKSTLTHRLGLLFEFSIAATKAKIGNGGERISTARQTHNHLELRSPSNNRDYLIMTESQAGKTRTETLGQACSVAGSPGGRVIPCFEPVRIWRPANPSPGCRGGKSAEHPIDWSRVFAARHFRRPECGHRHSRPALHISTETGPIWAT
jgi:hypothetical protein